MNTYRFTYVVEIDAENEIDAMMELQNKMDSYEIEIGNVELWEREKVEQIKP